MEETEPTDGSEELEGTEETEEIGESGSKPSYKRLILIVSLSLVTIGALIFGGRYLYWLKANSDACDLIWHGQFDKGRQEGEKALAIMSVLPDSKSMAVSYRLLASLYSARRKFDKAEEYTKQLLNFDKKTFGEKSLQYAEGLTDMALIKRKERRFDESEKLYKEAVAIYKSYPDHELETARTEALLSWPIIQQGRHEEGFKIIDESDAILKKHFGEQSFERVVGLTNKGFVFRMFKREKELKEIADFSYDLVTKPKEITQSNSQTVVAMILLAQLLSASEENEKAIKVTELAAVNCRNSVFAGEYNLFMADILEFNARLLDAVGKTNIAQPLYKRTAEIREMKF